MSTYNIYEFKDFHSLVYHVEKKIKMLLIQDSKLHMMDAEPSWSIELIEDEIMPALEKFLEAWDDDPTPQYLYDNSGGEPPITMSEIHSAAWREHQEAHS